MVRYLTFEIALHIRHNNFYAQVTPRKKDERQRKWRKNKETNTVAIMVYSLKKRHWGCDRIKNKCIKKKKKKTTSLNPLCNINHSSPKNLSPPSICINNTMDIAFLVQIRQSSKCGKTRNNKIFNLYSGSGMSSWVIIHCLLEDINHIYWFHWPKQSTRKQQRIQKWDPIPNKSYCTTLAYIRRTQG